ncbi:hypothetical protein [Nocardia vaccinii]|uniref:hypothetical protein n=1 Tax=Nocardia vaccinii TaxID=1822 RepID=UPI0012F4FC56|nr:hypothetical protein [Nocardia vaccinii]
MASSDPGRRAGRTATRILAALGVAGTIGAAALAYTDTHAATASTGTSSSNSGTTSGDSSTSTTRNGVSSDDSGTSSGTGTVPQIGTGSGDAHARSAGS